MNDELLERIEMRLVNIENQLFALNEWLVRYGQGLEPPVESPGIHLVMVRPPTAADIAHGHDLALELEAASRGNTRRKSRRDAGDPRGESE